MFFIIMYAYSSMRKLSARSIPHLLTAHKKRNYAIISKICWICSTNNLCVVDALCNCSENVDPLQHSKNTRKKLMISPGKCALKKTKMVTLARKVKATIL